jgi:hypothetical protein
MAAVHAALEASRYPEAWRLAEDQPDELRRSRAKSEVLYRAGDPSGALAQARQGLASAPDDLELLFRASSAALWMQEPSLATLYSARLAQAIEGARPALAPEEATAWEATARDFAERAQGQARHAEARIRAVARTRALSIGTFVLVLGLIALAARRAYGRSSNPVS